jgi:hypothetical protein
MTKKKSFWDSDQVADGDHGDGDDDRQGQVPAGVNDLLGHVVLKKHFYQ